MSQSTTEKYAKHLMDLQAQKAAAVETARELTDASTNLWMEKLQEMFPQTPVGYPDAVIQITPSDSPSTAPQLGDQLEKNNLEAVAIKVLKDTDPQSPHIGQVACIRIYCRRKG